MHSCFLPHWCCLREFPRDVSLPPALLRCVCASCVCFVCVPSRVQTWCCRRACYRSCLQGLSPHSARSAHLHLDATLPSATHGGEWHTLAWAQVVGAGVQAEEHRGRSSQLQQQRAFAVNCSIPPPALLTRPCVCVFVSSIFPMSASSSLSRIEFALNSAEASSAGSTASASSSVAASLKSGFGAVGNWLGTATSNTASTNGRLPSPGGATNAAGSATALASSAAATASATASKAATKASAAASKAGHQAKEFFSLMSSKVTGKEHVPAPLPPAVESTAGDVEEGGEGKSLIPSSDPGGPVSGLAAQFSNELSALTTLSWRNRMLAFFMSATAGLVMLCLSFMHVSLIFIGMPGKFALSYALANIFLMSASMFLVGPSKQLSQMFGPERFMVSSVYLSSLALLFYVTWAFNYFIVVLPVLVIQLVSLLAYVASYVPFGQTALTRICRWTLGRQLSFLSS